MYTFPYCQRKGKKDKLSKAEEGKSCLGPTIDAPKPKSTSTESSHQAKRWGAKSSALHPTWEQTPPHSHQQ